MKMSYLNESSFSQGPTTELSIITGFLSKQMGEQEEGVACSPLVSRGHIETTGVGIPKRQGLRKTCAYLFVCLFNGCFHSQIATETFFLSDAMNLLHGSLCQEGGGQRAIKPRTSHLKQCGGWTAQNTLEAQFPSS